MLVTDYMAGNVDQGVWEGELAFLVYGFVAALFCLYGAICYFGLKSAFPVLVPGIAGLSAYFLSARCQTPFGWLYFAFPLCLCYRQLCRNVFREIWNADSPGEAFLYPGRKLHSEKIGAKAGIFMAVCWR